MRILGIWILSLISLVLACPWVLAVSDPNYWKLTATANAGHGSIRNLIFLLLSAPLLILSLFYLAKLLLATSAEEEEIGNEATKAEIMSELREIIARTYRLLSPDPGYKGWAYVADDFLALLHDFKTGDLSTSSAKTLLTGISNNLAVIYLSLNYSEKYQEDAIIAKTPNWEQTLAKEQKLIASLNEAKEELQILYDRVKRYAVIKGVKILYSEGKMKYLIYADSKVLNLYKDKK